MEAVPRLPMLSFPAREAQEYADYGDILRKYIHYHYNEDAEQYKKEISELEFLRNTAISSQIDFMGCSTLKKYFCQLKFLTSRFPLEEVGSKFSFSWKSPFHRRSTFKGDLEIEINSILYNIASYHSSLGTIDSRTTADGMKISCTHFQCAAYAFQVLSENSGSEGEITSHLMAFMMNFCLSQAQECILEKSLSDNRKPNIITKVAMQVTEYLRVSMKNLDTFKKANPEGAEIVGSKTIKAWQMHCEFKIAYYMAVTSFHQGLVSEEQQKMGERIGYFQVAVDKLDEAMKLSKNIEKQKLTEDALTFTNDIIRGKLTAAQKENEFVYHEKIPPTSCLQEVKGASLVKCIPFSFTDEEVAGPDIFARLVPLEAHQASSMYSEEKAKLLRRVCNEVTEKNEELEMYLASMQLDSMSLGEDFDSLPQELVDACADLNSRSATKILTEIMNQINTSYNNLHAKISQMEELIMVEDEKQKEFNLIMGNKHEPSHIILEQKRELTKYKDALQASLTSNQALHSAVLQHKGNISVLSKSLKDIIQSLPSISGFENENDKTTRHEIQRLLSKVREMQIQRSNCESQLRQNLQDDDITKLLVTNEGNTERFFQEQLNKHKNLVDILEQNMRAQTNILQALSECNASYADTRRKLNQLKLQRTESISSLLSSYNVFLNITQKANEAEEFYSRLEGQINRLNSRLKSSCAVQEEEREGKLLGNMKKFGTDKTFVRNYSAEDNVNFSDTVSSGPKLKDYLQSGGGLKKAPFGAPGTNSRNLEATRGSIDIGHISMDSQVQQPSFSSDVFLSSTLSGDSTSTLFSTGMNAMAYLKYLPTAPTTTSFFPSQLQHGIHNFCNSAHSSNVSSSSHAAEVSLTSTATHSLPPVTVSNVTIYSETVGKNSSCSSSHPYPYVYNSQCQTPYANQTPQQTLPNVSYKSFSAVHPTDQLTANAQSISYVPSYSRSYASTSYHSGFNKTGVLPIHSAIPAADASKGHPIIPGSNVSPIHTGSIVPSVNPGVSVPGAISIKSGISASVVPPAQTVIPGSGSSSNQSEVAVCRAPSVHQGVSGSVNHFNQSIAVPSTKKLTYTHTRAIPLQVTLPIYSHNNISGGLPSSNFSSKGVVSHGINSFPQEQNKHAGEDFNVSATQLSNVASHSYDHQMPYQSTQTSSPSNTSQLSALYSGSSTSASCAVGGNFVRDGRSVGYYQYHMPQKGSSMDYGYQNVSSPIISYNYNQHTYAIPKDSSHFSAVTSSSTSACSNNNGSTKAATYTISAGTTTNENVHRAYQEQNTSNVHSNKNTVSNLDLLSDIDLNASGQQTQWCPLTPKSASSETDSAPPASIPNQNVTPGLDSNEDKYNYEKTAKEVECTTTTNSRAVIDLTKLVLPKISAAMDPLSDNQTLSDLASDAERFSKQVQSLDKMSLNGLTDLDVKWNEFSDQLEAHYSSLTVSVGRCYPLKNRYPDNLPFDSTRVILPSVRDDYINASFVQLKSVKESIPFVLTQAPMSNTIADFWTMIWERNVEVIVALNTNAEIKGQWYIPGTMEENLEIGGFSIVIKQIRSPEHQSWTQRTVQVSQIATRTYKVAMHVQFVSWPPGSMPESASFFLQFINEVHELYNQQRNKMNPVVVHCTSGTGRSGVFAILSSYIKHVKSRGVLCDIWSLSLELCQQRRAGLQDKSHFKFLYSASLYYVQDLLMKRGILSDKLSFGEAIEEKTHVRHPSADLLSADLYKMKAKLGLGEEAEVSKDEYDLGNKSSHEADSTLTQTHSASAISTASAASSDSIFSVPTNAISAASTNSDLPFSATHKDGIKLGNAELPPNLAMSLDPNSFSLPSPIPNQAKKITKESFFDPNNINKLGQCDSKAHETDPLSDLDPMWNLKKK